jgi:hypothetical protein
MLRTSKFHRRHYIGLLDMDFEPDVIPSQWNLTDMPHRAQKLSYEAQVEPLEIVPYTTGATDVELPVSELVDYYDRIINRASWIWCGY